MCIIWFDWPQRRSVKFKAKCDLFLLNLPLTLLQGWCGQRCGTTWISLPASRETPRGCGSLKNTTSETNLHLAKNISRYFWSSSAPAHRALTQAIPGASEADSVTIVANRNWKVSRQLETNWAGQRSNHLVNTTFFFWSPMQITGLILDT